MNKFFERLRYAIHILRNKPIIFGVHFQSGFSLGIEQNDKLIIAGNEFDSKEYDNEYLKFEPEKWYHITEERDGKNITRIVYSIDTGKSVVEKRSQRAKTEV